MKTIVAKFSTALLLAGIIILMLGCYYWIIKAGIPYQDTTVEMQIQYSINYGIGEILTKMGIIIAVLGAAGSVIFRKKL